MYISMILSGFFAGFGIIGALTCFFLGDTASLVYGTLAGLASCYFINRPIKEDEMKKNNMLEELETLNLEGLDIGALNEETNIGVYIKAYQECVDYEIYYLDEKRKEILMLLTFNKEKGYSFEKIVNTELYCHDMKRTDYIVGRFLKQIHDMHKLHNMVNNDKTSEYTKEIIKKLNNVKEEKLLTDEETFEIEKSKFEILRKIKENKEAQIKTIEHKLNKIEVNIRQRKEKEIEKTLKLLKQRY